MSFRAVQLVMHAPIAPPTLKLTALVLADALNEKTRQLNPSLQTVADTVGIDRRQAQRYVQQLVSMGLLSVIANAKGGPPGTTPSYLLRLDRIASLTPLERTERPRRDDTHDAPTGGAHVTPTGCETGDMHDADGCHPRRGRVTPMTPTGGAGVTQTEKEPRREQRREPGLQQTLDIATPADAGPPPDVPARASRSKLKAPTKTGPTWEAYSAAFLQRYGTSPVSNGRVNGMLSKLIDRIGADEAPQVARFYVEHPGSYYAEKVHGVACLLADAEKLRTEWATGRHAPERGRAQGGPRTLEELTAGAGRLLGLAPRGKQQTIDELDADMRRRLKLPAASFSTIDYTEGVERGTAT